MIKCVSVVFVIFRDDVNNLSFSGHRQQLELELDLQLRGQFNSPCLRNGHSFGSNTASHTLVQLHTMISHLTAYRPCYTRWVKAPIVMFSHERLLNKWLTSFMHLSWSCCYHAWYMSAQFILKYLWSRLLFRNLCPHSSTALGDPDWHVYSFTWAPQISRVLYFGSASS